VKKEKTPKFPRSSIKRDYISPQDYNFYQIRFSCEDCSHFSKKSDSCTLGYHSRWHKKSFQQSEYERTGKMALCRFIEID